MTAIIKIMKLLCGTTRGLQKSKVVRIFNLQLINLRSHIWAQILGASLQIQTIPCSLRCRFFFSTYSAHLYEALAVAESCLKLVKPWGSPYDWFAFSFISSFPSSFLGETSLVVNSKSSRALWSFSRFGNSALQKSSKSMSSAENDWEN